MTHNHFTAMHWMRSHLRGVGRALMLLLLPMWLSALCVPCHAAVAATADSAGVAAPTAHCHEAAQDHEPQPCCERHAGAPCGQSGCSAAQSMVSAPSDFLLAPHSINVALAVGVHDARIASANVVRIATDVRPSPYSSPPHYLLNCAFLI